jgi:hypothetical protein
LADTLLPVEIAKDFVDRPAGVTAQARLGHRRTKKVTKVNGGIGRVVQNPREGFAITAESKRGHFRLGLDITDVSFLYPGLWSEPLDHALPRAFDELERTRRGGCRAVDVAEAAFDKGHGAEEPGAHPVLRCSTADRLGNLLLFVGWRGAVDGRRRHRRRRPFNDFVDGPEPALAQIVDELVQAIEASLRLRHGYPSALIGRERDADERADPGESCLERIGAKLCSLHPQEIADLTERTCDLVLSDLEDLDLEIAEALDRFVGVDPLGVGGRPVTDLHEFRDLGINPRDQFLMSNALSHVWTPLLRCSADQRHDEP